ncbi:MAG: Rid family detoxifying hydrolase [Chloroflexota bacterium]
MRQRVQTDLAPAAVGPYSQAIIVENMVYTAGQAAIDPQTRKLVEGGIEIQTARVLKNLSAVLEAAGTSMHNVIKSTVYLTNMADFAAMNAVYGEYFNPEMPPARTTIAAAALPLGTLVEIECIALLSDD